MTDNQSGRSESQGSEYPAFRAWYMNRDGEYPYPNYPLYPLPSESTVRVPNETLAEWFRRRFYFLWDDTRSCDSVCVLASALHSSEHDNMIFAQRNALLAEARSTATSSVKLKGTFWGRPELQEYWAKEEKFVFADGSAAIHYYHSMKYEELGDLFYLAVALNSSPTCLCNSSSGKHNWQCPDCDLAEAAAQVASENRSIDEYNATVAPRLNELIDSLLD